MEIDYFVGDVLCASACLCADEAFAKILWTDCLPAGIVGDPFDFAQGQNDEQEQVTAKSKCKCKCKNNCRSRSLRDDNKKDKCKCNSKLQKTTADPLRR